MKSKVSIGKGDRISQAYPESLYRDVPSEKLIVYSIYSMLQKNEVVTFERLVKECFTLFPKSFCFTRYPNWPDSMRLDRPIRSLRADGLIVGKPQGTFTLTNIGIRKAKEVEKLISIYGLAQNVIPQLNKQKARRRQEASIISNLKNSRYFKNFQAKDTISVNKSTLRRLFFCTIETPMRIVKQNIEYCKNIAKEADERELMNFISYCEAKLLGKVRK